MKPDLKTYFNIMPKLNFDLINQKSKKDRQLEVIKQPPKEVEFKLDMKAFERLIEMLSNKPKPKRKVRPQDPLKRMIIPPPIL